MRNLFDGTPFTYIGLSSMYDLHSSDETSKLSLHWYLGTCYNVFQLHIVRVLLSGLVFGSHDTDLQNE